MKKHQAALAALQNKELPNRIKDHEHVHAANCGHTSYVHGNHIDYEHDGHYHYTLDGKTYRCDGPNAKIIQFPGASNKKSTTKK